MRGEVKVESVVDEGTTVEVHIPVSIGKQDDSLLQRELSFKQFNRITPEQIEKLIDEHRVKESEELSDIIVRRDRTNYLEVKKDEKKIIAYGSFKIKMLD